TPRGQSILVRRYAIVVDHGLKASEGFRRPQRTRRDKWDGEKEFRSCRLRAFAAAIVPRKIREAQNRNLLLIFLPTVNNLTLPFCCFTGGGVRRRIHVENDDERAIWGMLT